MDIAEQLSSFYERLYELHRLNSIGAVLGWDQRVCMPPNAAEERAGQFEYLAGLVHQRFTDPQFSRTVDELFEAHDTLSSDDQVNIREIKRLLDRERKLPEEFVREESQAASIGYNTWVKARPANDWKSVEPALEKLVDLNKRKADLLGYQDHPYNPLLDIFEPGAKLQEVKPLLLDLADELRGLIPPITEKQCEQEPLKGHYDAATQQRLCERIAREIGFDFESGRLDKTAHPFMTSCGPRDFRITTRYFDDNFIPALYGSMHETGHALYEMGLPPDKAGTPLGEAVSLGIHESQSRMWENLVGRSREFTAYLSGILSEFFPGQPLSPEELWGKTNRVCPSLIRVEADEVTYNQHIVIRMLLEEALITNELKVADLPGAWNDLYENYLGVRPPDFKDGVMQDVHWYTGSMGYFPTYSLGNLFGAMMMRKAREAMPDLSDQIGRGEFAGLLGWLLENVHQHGMRFRSAELVERIAGAKPSAEPFVEYVKEKFLG